MSPRFSSSIVAGQTLWLICNSRSTTRRATGCAKETNRPPRPNRSLEFRPETLPRPSHQRHTGARNQRKSSFTQHISYISSESDGSASTSSLSPNQLLEDHSHAQLRATDLPGCFPLGHGVRCKRSNRVRKRYTALSRN